MHPVLCPGEIPHFLIFDFSTSPPLLYYTYIPTILVSLFLGFVVLRHDKRSLANRLFFLIVLFFSLWVLDILVLWVASFNRALYFGWQITPVFEIPLFIFSFYFAFVITDKEKRDIHPALKVFFLGLMASTFAVLPTKLNITSYDIRSCEGVPGRFWDIMYGGEMIAIAGIIGLCLNRFRALAKSDPFRKQIALFGIGITSFLILFTGSNMVGQITRIQEISFLGSLGMTVFLGVLTYMIVRFRTFDLKLFATQALMVATNILIGSQLLYPTSSLDLIVTSVTLVACVIVSFYVIRSVRREIEAKEKEHAQREQIERLAGNLEIANRGQENLIHIMNHQIKGYLGITRSIFAELLQTVDYGEIPESAKPLLAKGLERTAAGLEYVQGILVGSSAADGTLRYNMKPIDVKAVCANVIPRQKEIAVRAGLAFESRVEEGDYTAIGDPIQLEEAFKNLITNAIKYNSPHGTITITLARRDDRVVLSVKDTGIGIPEEDKPRLFTPGGRGTDSTKYNSDSSGFGLAFVKAVVETHKGEVYYKANSPEKGVTFFVELPVAARPVVENSFRAVCDSRGRTN